MNLEDLEELLSDFLPGGFQVETNKKGQLVIYTGLRQDDDGELVDIKGDLEEDTELEFGDEEFEPLEEDDPDDE